MAQLDNHDAIIRGAALMRIERCIRSGRIDIDYILGVIAQAMPDPERSKRLKQTGKEPEDEPGPVAPAG